MFTLLLALHILLAVFAIGPLVYAATTAGRGIRRGDAVATAVSARLLRSYGYASLLVVLIGMGLMSTTSSYTGKQTAEIADTYIWLSLVLWALAMALIFGVAVPTLTKATDLMTREQSVVSLTVRVAVSGGVVGVIFAGIVFLMVYRPGT